MSGKEKSLKMLTDVMDRLLSENGCPWDREQTHESLKRYLIEESYEVLDAVDSGDEENLCEELGDVLLQVVFHAAIAERRGSFDIGDVIEKVSGKMISRHPHVFADENIDTAAGVEVRWEEIKKEEKKHRKGILRGVPRGMAPVPQALKLQEKAAGVGFDWEREEEVWDKIAEEMEELRSAGDAVSREEELGDLLFAITNLARFMQINPENALMKANRKFRERFSYIEKETEGFSGSPGLEEMEKLWQESKKKSRNIQ